MSFFVVMANKRRLWRFFGGGDGAEKALSSDRDSFREDEAIDPYQDM